MSATFRLTAAAVLTLAMLVAGTSIFGPGKASAAGATIECYVPLQIVCKIGHPDGIKQVIFTGDTVVGEIEWFNEVYEGCPTSVEIVFGGDHILSAGPMTIEVIPCDPGVNPRGMGLTNKGGNDSRYLKLAALAEQESTHFHLVRLFPSGKPLGLLLFLVAVDGVEPHPGDCYSHWPSCLTVEAYECAHLGVNCPPPSRP